MLGGSAMENYSVMAQIYNVDVLEWPRHWRSKATFLCDFKTPKKQSNSGVGGLGGGGEEV